MPGIKALRKLQIGKEAATDQGTAVAATSNLRLQGVWKDDLELIFPVEDVGYISGRDRTHIQKYMATMNATGDMTFEQLPYILEASIAATTPTTDSGSGYIYTYTFPTTSQGTINTYTLEGGDDQQEEEASFGYVADFELSGSAGGPWTVSANYVGRQSSTGDFTTSSDITVTEVETALFGKSKLYIDTDTDTIGTTIVSQTLLDASLKVNSGWVPKFTADGVLYFSFIARTSFEALLDLTFEHNASAVAEKAAWRNQTARLIQLLIEGSALTSSGAFSVKTIRIRLAGKWESFDILGDRDGNDIVKGTFRGRFNADSSLFGSIVVVNELTALP